MSGESEGKCNGHCHKTALYSFILVQIEELPPLVADLLIGHITWAEVEQKYPIFVAQETPPQ